MKATKTLSHRGNHKLTLTSCEWLNG